MKYIEIWQAINYPGEHRDSISYLKERFQGIENTKPVRAILRAMGQSGLELEFFGDNTTELDIYSKNVWEDYFYKINLAFGYLGQSQTIYDLLITLCRILELKELADSNSSSHARQLGLEAYQLLFSFGLSQEIETILRTLDAYKEDYPDGVQLFRYPLPTFKAQVDLEGWRTLMASFPTSEALRCFTLADFLKDAQGKAPNSLEHAQAIERALLKGIECSKEQIVRVFGSLTKEQEALTVCSLSDHHLRLWINDDVAFMSVMKNLKTPEGQRRVLEKLTPPTLRQLYDKSVKNSFLKSVHHRDCYLYLAKEVITPDEILKEINTWFKMEVFMSLALPNTVSIFDFMTQVLEPRHVQGMILSFYEFNALLEKISDPRQRLPLLQQTIGRDLCRDKITTTSQLKQTVVHLPNYEGVQFLTWAFEVDEIKEFAKDHKNFKLLKRHLRLEKKQELNQRLYDADTLEAKAMLREIKNTIDATSFSFRYSETAFSTFLKGYSKKVPSTVLEQLEEFAKLSKKEQTHQEALEHIRVIGEKAANPRLPWLTQFSQLWSGKSETDEYYEKFANKEIFEKSFKKP